MKQKSILTLFILLFSLLSFGQDEPLFRIVQDGKIGYINKKGEIVIQPQFIVGSSFWDGLAAVRKDGLYGFIDKTGKYVIPPKYDYANSFYGSYANLDKGDKTIYLYRCGEELKTSDTETYSLEGNLFTITSKSGKVGVFNCRTKALILDTIYDEVVDYHDGIFVVNNYGDELIDGIYHLFNYSMIDTAGNVLFPFNKYNSLGRFNNGVAIAGNNRRDYPYWGVTGPIDRKGNQLFQIKLAKNERFFVERYNKGLAPIVLSNKRISTEEVIDDSSEKTHQGYINLKGEIVLNDTLIERVTEFSNRRAFIRRRNEDKYRMINTQMEKVGNSSFDEVISRRIMDGYATVKSNSKWGIIDTNGRYVIPPKYTEIDDTGIIDSCFFYSNEKENDKTLFGLAKLDGSIITKPLYENIHDYRGRLFSVEIDKKQTYINNKGEIIWQESGDTLLLDYTIDFKNLSAHRVNQKSKEVSECEENFIKDSLNFIVNKKTVDTFYFTNNKPPHQYLGHTVTLANLTNKEIEVWTTNRELFMFVQAKDKKGKWNDIEFIRRRRCGNSYRRMNLGKNKSWDFIVPDYKGSFKTKLRMKLRYVETPDSTGSGFSPNGITIYSNEYEGSINPGQFWNELNLFQYLKATNIRDPYH